MVSNLTIAGIVTTLLITLFLPIILIIIWSLKNKGKRTWSAWLFGALGFFIMQLLIRVPLLSLLATTDGYMDFIKNHYIIYCLALAFTAGLFEVIARYAVAKIMRKDLTYERGIAAGLGHGGIESMLLIGMTYLNNLLYALMINTNSFDTIVNQANEAGVDTAGLLEVKTQLIESSSSLFFLAGFERILTIVFHVAMSLLVCYFVAKKKTWLGIILCLALHTLVDFISSVVSGLGSEYLGNRISQNTSYIIIYSLLAVIAIGSTILIRHIRREWKDNKAAI